MSEELRSSIDAAVANSPVHVFMKGTPDAPQCGFSKASCDVFRALGVEFTATNVLENLDAYRTELGQITQWPTIPQIFVNGEFIGGCDILIEKYNQGELRKLLVAETAVVQDGE